MNLLRVLLRSVCGSHPSDVPPKSKISVQIEQNGNGRRSGAFLHISFKNSSICKAFGVRQRPPQGAEFVCVPCGANNSKSVGLIPRAGSTPATGTTSKQHHRVISRRRRRQIDRWCCFSFPNRTHCAGLRFGLHAIPGILQRVSGLFWYCRIRTRGLLETCRGKKRHAAAGGR